MDEEKIFNPFEGNVVCECEKNMPEVIKAMIPTAFQEDESYSLCIWCEFVRNFGMVRELENIMKKVVKPVTQTMPDNSPSGMEFGSWFVRDYEEYANMRRFFGAVITDAREKLKLSIKDVSLKLDLPEYILKNLENGEEEITVERNTACADFVPAAAPAAVAGKLSAVSCWERKWWEGKCDSEIEKVICKFLLEQKSERGLSK